MSNHYMSTDLVLTSEWNYFNGLQDVNQSTTGEQRCTVGTQIQRRRMIPALRRHCRVHAHLHRQSRQYTANSIHALYSILHTTTNHFHAATIHKLRLHDGVKSSRLMVTSFHYHFWLSSQKHTLLFLWAKSPSALLFIDLNLFFIHTVTKVQSQSYHSDTQ